MRDRLIRLLMALTAVLAMGTARAQPAAGTWGQPATVCTITDERINEISGIAMSRVNPGLYFVHNDSGDTARFFVMDKSGKARATVNVTNAQAIDWEDIAAAHDAERRPMVYLADIGDNLAVRLEVAVYAVPEPRVNADGEPQMLEAAAKTLRFRYPDGPRDAETLMADPMGRALYVVAKEREAKPSGIYRLEPKWDGPVQTAVKIGQVTFSDALPFWPNLSTGGDISPDGTRMVVRTYQQAYEWRIPKGKQPEDVVGAPPTAYPLALDAQGEAICYGSNSRAWLTATEQLPAPVRMYTWKNDER